MRAGRLRHWVTLQSQSTTTNEYGENVGTWADVESMFAGIEPLSGKEMLSSGQNLATQSTRIVIRYCQHVTPQMRIVHGSTIYDIEAVINRDEKNKEIELVCTRGGQHDPS